MRAAGEAGINLPGNGARALRTLGLERASFAGLSNAPSCAVCVRPARRRLPHSPVEREPAPDQSVLPDVVPSERLAGAGPHARSSRNAGVRSCPHRHCGVVPPSQLGGRSCPDGQLDVGGPWHAPLTSRLGGTHGSRCARASRSGRRARPRRGAPRSRPARRRCCFSDWPARPRGPRLAPAVGSVARERTQPRRARNFAQANPNPTSSAGPKAPSVSSMGTLPRCASGVPVTGRSPWCSRRLGGVPRGRGRGRRGGRGRRRRSPGQPPSRRSGCSSP